MILRCLFLATLAFTAACSSTVAAGAGADSTASADAPLSSDAGSPDAAAAVTGAGLTSLAKATAAAVEVELLAAHPLAVGPNRVYYRVTSAGQSVQEAAIVQRPVMQMMGMQHACPVTNPGTVATDGLFAADLVFQMASSSSDTWHLEVDVTPDGGSQQTVVLGSIPVAAAPWAKTLKAGTGMAVERYVVAVRFAAPPKVGLNDYEVLVYHASADLMAYEPVADAVLTATPDMPSMGHGSQGNVAPTHTSGAVYSGQLHLTMPGDWRLTLQLERAGQALGNAVFEWNL
jgi:hypothetical protein